MAEFGAAFLCADLGLELKRRADHAAYIQSRLRVVNDDKRFVFSATAHAQRAADYLHRPHTGLAFDQVFGAATMLKTCPPGTAK